MESKANSKRVSILLHSSIQHPGQDKETQEIELTGSYIAKPQSSYLKYEEQQENGAVQTTVKMAEDQALIMRSGAINMRLPFTLNEIRLGKYNNGPVELKLYVKTSAIEFKEEPNSSNGRFHVQYQLIDGDAKVGTYEITMTYTEVIA